MISLKLTNKEIALVRNMGRFSCSLISSNALATFNCIYFEAGIIYGDVDEETGTISYDPLIIRNKTNPLLGTIANIADPDTDIEYFDKSVCNFDSIFEQYYESTIEMLTKQGRVNLVTMLTALHDFYDFIRHNLETLYSQDVMSYVCDKFDIPEDELLEQHSSEDQFEVAKALLRAKQSDITRCPNCKYSEYMEDFLSCNCPEKEDVISEFLDEYNDLHFNIDDFVEYCDEEDEFDLNPCNPNPNPTRCIYFEPKYLQRIK